MNTPLQLGGAVKNLEERKASLLAAAEFRPTHRVVAVAPVGTGKLDEAPDRMDNATQRVAFVLRTVFEPTKS